MLRLEMNPIKGTVYFFNGGTDCKVYGEVECFYLISIDGPICQLRYLNFLKRIGKEHFYLCPKGSVVLSKKDIPSIFDSMEICKTKEEKTMKNTNILVNKGKILFEKQEDCNEIIVGRISRSQELIVYNINTGTYSISKLQRRDLDIPIFANVDMDTFAKDYNNYWPEWEEYPTKIKLFKNFKVGKGIVAPEDPCTVLTEKGFKEAFYPDFKSYEGAELYLNGIVYIHIEESDDEGDEDDDEQNCLLKKARKNLRLNARGDFSKEVRKYLKYLDEVYPDEIGQ